MLLTPGDANMGWGQNADDILQVEARESCLAEAPNYNCNRPCLLLPSALDSTGLPESHGEIHHLWCPKQGKSWIPDVEQDLLKHEGVVSQVLTLSCALQNPKVAKLGSIRGTDTAKGWEGGGKEASHV